VNAMRFSAKGGKGRGGERIKVGAASLNIAPTENAEGTVSFSWKVLDLRGKGGRILWAGDRKSKGKKGGGLPCPELNL